MCAFQVGILCLPQTNLKLEFPCGRNTAALKQANKTSATIYTRTPCTAPNECPELGTLGTVFPREDMRYYLVARFAALTLHSKKNSFRIFPLHTYYPSCMSLFAALRPPPLSRFSHRVPRHCRLR